MGGLYGLYCHSNKLPAVCSLGWQDVGEKHLCELPEVEELISARTECYMEVRTIFLQCGLLKELCVLYCRGEQKELAFYTMNYKENDSVCDHNSSTFLSCFGNYFNVLHGNFKKLFRDEGCNINLEENQMKLLYNYTC